MNIKFLSALTLTCSLVVGGLALADSTSDAVDKVQKVIDNNIPAENRDVLTAKLKVVSDAADALSKAMDKLENVVKNNIPEKNRAIISDKIEGVKSAIAADLGASVTAQPAPKKEDASGGSYCQAACTTYDGKADLNYASGVAGLNKILAQQAAETAVSKSYSCNFGVSLVGCEDESSNKTLWTCQYACESNDGHAVMEYAAVGQGGSQLEAGVNATKATQDKYACNFGAVKVQCSK